MDIDYEYCVRHIRHKRPFSNFIFSYKGIVMRERSKEQEDQDLEKKCVSLKTHFRNTEGGGYRLYIVNSGQSEARNVQVFLDDKFIREHPVAITGSNIPTEIGSYSEVSCLLGVCKDCSPPFKIYITWEDNSQEQEKYYATITH